MNESLRAPVGSLRPGGRTAGTRRAVLLAAQEELIQHGYGDFSIPRVAARAGVNKTTIYRRWVHRESLISDLIMALAETTVPIPDTGDFAEDLQIFGYEIARALRGRNGLTARALFAAAAGDESLQSQLSDFYGRRYVLAETMVGRAIDKGEVATDVVPAKVVRVLAGPLYYSLTVLGREPSHEDTADAVHAALAYAGVARRSPSGSSIST